MGDQIFSRKLAKDGKLHEDIYKLIKDYNVENDHHLDFLTKQTIKNLKSCFNTPSSIQKMLLNIEKLRKLWLEILVDSIFYLRRNDSRDSLSTIKNGDVVNTDFIYQNVYGMSELFNYFKQFSDFEHTLYGADKYYRDHIIHPLMVWLIGLSIIREFGIEFSMRTVKTTKNSQIVTSQSENPPEHIEILLNEVYAMWSIIALTHDLGYPLEKVDKINDQLEKMLNQFGKIGFSRSRFSFETQHDYLVRFLIDFISSIIIRNPNGEWFNHKRVKYFTKFAKSWEMFDHGIVSSLILFKALTFFIECGYENLLYGTGLDYAEARQFSIRSEILHSIAAHTTPKIYHIYANTLSFLLVLCDELQEWNRPTLSDMKNGVYGSAIDVTIEELSISKDGISKIYCAIKYNAADIKEQESHVARLFKTWIERFRPALEAKEKKIDFKWSIQFGEDQPWEFRLDPTKNMIDTFICDGPEGTFFPHNYKLLFSNKNNAT